MIVAKRTCIHVRTNGVRCQSTYVRRDSDYCNAHDPNYDFHGARVKGGKRSGRHRLSKRMQRLVQMLFSDASMAPTLDRIEPKSEYDRECGIHILMIEGQRAVLDDHGLDGLHCLGYRCQDQSLFAKAMRVLRISERQENGETVYVHWDTDPDKDPDRLGTIIPKSEIARITRLVQERA